ncbi:MAG TPA: alcohol dehydrogenase catalytic domain-containing protein [Longimicrobiales bacterium]|nr:alcohol dehydrogenase catalytic domain-containing protein [Longimicrobiales bacterium]
MRAIRFHYRPVRYLWTRWAAARRPALALGPLGCVAMDDVAPPPLPGPDWVRVETSLSGICGSDLAALTAHDSFTLEPFGAYPFTFGHENVGRVVEVGAGAAPWSAGDRVVVNPMLSCAQRGLEPPCPACARGEYGLCRRTTDGAVGTGPMIGYCPAVGGGWSRFFVAHKSQLHALGELSDEVGVLTDPFASALRPVLLHPPREDDTVLVIGAGTIGALTIKALRLTGWTGPIATLARYPFQRELAERAGASPIFARREEVYAWAASLPHARSYRPTLAPKFVEGGPSLVYDTVGTRGSVGDALALAREGGRIVLVGAAAKLSADWTRIWYRQLAVAGVFAYGLAPLDEQERDIYDASLDLIRSDGLQELGMLTHVFDLEDYRAAISAALDKGGHRSIKVAFRPGA